MSIITDDEYAIAPNESKEYCKWCWGHDFGNCDFCAVYKNRKLESNTVKEST